MQAVTITQITPPELQVLIENSIRTALSGLEKTTHTEEDEILTVPEAAKFLSLSVPTIYGLIHREAIPFMKRSRRCYFSKLELIEYLKKGRKCTLAEIDADTDLFLANLRKDA
jgi:excisionase family DNA binding protein